MIVLGIIALLVSISLPPLQLARRQAMRTQCRAQLQQIGLALENARNEYDFYPFWDDGGAPIRYTWIDVLIQRRLLGSSGHHGKDAQSGSMTGRRAVRVDGNIGYCPEDGAPDFLNAARHQNLIYPLNRTRGGIDYSYGIGVPLSAGGWAWRPNGGSSGDDRLRRFPGHLENASARVLAGDAYTSAIYNLSGRAIKSHVWNDPTQYDNTVAWQRHAMPSANPWSANLLFQDGHVGAVRYVMADTEPVNTMRSFVWYLGEPGLVGPDHRRGQYWYPNVPPPSYQSVPPGDVFPSEMLPYWYTSTQRWTLITHK